MFTALEELKVKISRRMNLIPFDPTPSERAAYDAYLNCLHWAEGLMKKEKDQILDAIDAGHLYNDGFVYTGEDYYFQKFEHN